MILTAYDLLQRAVPTPAIRGAAVGVAASVALVRLPLLQRILFEVTAAEPGVVASVLVVLVTTALLAALVAPARLVARPDLTGLLGREHS